LRRFGYRYRYLGNDLIEAFSDDNGQPDVARLLTVSRRSTPGIHQSEEPQNKVQNLSLSAGGWQGGYIVYYRLHALENMLGI